MAGAFCTDRRCRQDAAYQLPDADVDLHGLFYGWGFGLWGHVGPAAQLALALGIFFLIQVPLSRMWLRRFEYGPPSTFGAC